ncbi:MAG: hypothetical protein ABJA35_06500 [Parafilimonas sp.]
MRTSSSPPEKKPLSFFLICVTAIALSGFLIFSIFSKNKKKEPGNDAIMLSLIQQSSVLQNAMADIDSLNAIYGNTLSRNDEVDKNRMLDSLNILLTQKENNFEKLVDSLQMNASSFNKNSFDLYNRIIASYRSSLQQSIALSAIRNITTVADTSYHLDTFSLLKIQTELQAKQTEINILTNQLEASKNVANINTPQNFKKYLSQQDSMLNELLESEKQKNENLTSYNDKLKRDNLKLKDQLDKSSVNNENENLSAQQTKDQVNAQLNLEKVDCYLLRADATQIISNAKQRADLLESALSILNTLSQSSNASIQQQAKLKMAKLKSIAANNHD